MKQHTKQRHRGVIFTLKGWDKLQTARATTELNENAGNNFTLEELADRMKLALHTVSKIMGRQEVVDRGSVQKAFSAFGLELVKTDYTQPTEESKDVEVRSCANPQQDWGEAKDVSIFYNRSDELLQLQRSLIEKNGERQIKYSRIYNRLSHISKVFDGIIHTNFFIGNIHETTY
ncbi:MAG: hypothetical protein KME29_06265 [Calothrix sp. FI2-JRJ7]|jgi:hypothetical protein|nr:hypothetical protein [Calothrix sp. FI2-JRJ7]